MQLPFSKYEGTGNDFVVIDHAALQGEGLTPAEVRRLCHRHRGVGADGVLLVEALAQGRFRMTVYNPDASRALMCGNGIRCVARHILCRRGGQAGTPPDTPLRLDIETDAGLHVCHATDAQVTVEMRPASFDPSQISATLGDAPLIDADFEVDGQRLQVTAVSMGNPHLVLFTALPETQAALAERLGQDARFSAGVNVGFATLDPDGALTLRVFERGAGWTEACGTGACAAAAAAVQTGRAQRGAPLCVHLPGGDLHITVQGENEPVHMQGPAHHVFDGVWPRAELGPRKPARPGRIGRLEALEKQGHLGRSTE